jgi:hypothetical protein
MAPVGLILLAAALVLSIPLLVGFIAVVTQIGKAIGL